MAPTQSAPEKDSPPARAKIPWWFVFVDVLDAVPMLVFLAALVAFNKSAYGRRVYAEMWRQFPDKAELAKYMMQDLTGSIALKWFWGSALFFALMDLGKVPKFLYDLKIQKNRPPPTLAYFAKVSALNLLAMFAVMGPVTQYVMYPLLVRRGGEGLCRTIPSAAQSIKEFLICEAWFEFWLYASHRIMHLPALYKWTHKRHHVHTSPFSVANFYATPFEHVFQNNGSGLIMQLLPVHPSTAWFFIAYRYFETVTSHSGYALPFSTNALFHNYHHRMFEGNYGINAGFPFMDLLMGTADDYFQWRWKWFQTHTWVTNRKLPGTDAAEKELMAYEGVDEGGAAYKSPI